jgi:Primase C terminal 2 (PriCT-2)/Bifunctional DNA primase/polymerase, N-terminal
VSYRSRPVRKPRSCPAGRSFGRRRIICRGYSGGENIAVILGAASGELVDIDLDCPEALALADLYLSATGAVFGRASKPRSHRLFVAPGAVYESFADPISGKTLIELRGAGRDGGAHATLFPPSIADGERREWHGDTIAPAAIDATALRTAVAWLGIGCLVLRHVSATAARNPGRDLPDLLWEADHALGRRALDWLGLPHPDAPRRYPRPRREMSRAELDLAKLVAEIPNNCGWREWNAIGLAIFAADSSDHGLTVFDDFSAKSPKYDPHSVQERWRNYRRSPPNRTGIGKLIALALAAGWRPPERREAAQ